MRAAIVTGGASGIGLAICAMLAHDGWCVFMVDNDGERGAVAARRIDPTGRHVRFEMADVANEDDVERLAAVVAAAGDPVGLLVNNAAVMRFARVVDMSVGDWDRVIAVNLRGAFLMCRRFIPMMKEGAIVNIGSVHGSRTTPNVAPYAASKAALEAFTRALSIECAEARIRVNCVVSGSVNTGMLWGNPNVVSGVEEVEGPVAEPEAMAQVVSFLASDRACAVTGATLVADCGLLARL